MWQEHVDPVLLENEMVWNTMKVSQQSFFQKVLTQVIYMLFILSPANNSYTFVTGCYWLKIDEDHVQLLLTGGSTPFVRRRCDCLASSALFTNTQTYLLTYLQRGCSLCTSQTSWRQILRTVLATVVSLCFSVSEHTNRQHLLHNGLTGQLLPLSNSTDFAIQDDIFKMQLHTTKALLPSAHTLSPWFSTVSVVMPQILFKAPQI